MSKWIARLLFLLPAVTLLVPAVFGQDDPNHERGTRPGLSYRVDGLDTVNMFNGNVNLTIPLGFTYPVGGTLSYSFMAHYATNGWESMTHEEDIEGDPFGSRTYTYWYPGEHANAGLGWIVSLGRLDTTKHPEDESDAYMYISPDGARHGFKPTLHENNPGEPAVSRVEYTRDGTYLRLTYPASKNEYKVEFPNGHIHTFDALGRLKQMEDPFGNFVKVEYKTRSQVLGPGASSPGSTVWVITDSVGREQRVFFVPGWAYFEELQLGDSQPMPKSHELVEKLELEAFDGQTATYTFHYDAIPVEITGANENDPFFKTSRRCSTGVQDPEVPTFVRVSLLSNLLMPHNIEYQFVTDRGNRTGCSTTAFGGISGNITNLTLPTGGTIDWTYQVYRFPTLGRPSVNAGIEKRTARRGDGTVMGVTEYQQGAVSEQVGDDVYRTAITKDGDNTIVNATKHYFAACPKRDWCGSALEYGLPHRRQNHLSTEVLLPNASGALEVKRSNYVRYEADNLYSSVLQWKPRNQRVVWQRSEYEDGHYAEVQYSEFDGLGHYRKTELSGDFDGGNTRTTWTNFNPGVPSYQLNANGTLVTPYAVPTAPWILTTFDGQWTSTPDVNGVETYSRTSACFDSKGFMTSRRTHRALVQVTSPSLLTFTHDSGDLLAVFERDAAGNLVMERYFGGDKAAAPSQSCDTAYSGQTYRIDHSYAYGVEQSSYHVASNAPMSFYLTDNVVDPTGLIAERRVARGINLSDGLSTTFEYDLLGRIKETAGVRRRATYTYTNQPAKLTISEREGASGPFLKTETLQFDEFGRLTRETRTMPGSVTATRTTNYNGAGWKTDTTEWGASAPTRFAYDGFGRITAIQPADPAISATTIAYSGISQVSRTSKIRTGGTAASPVLTPSTTTEVYDRQGRLIRVVEPPAAVGGIGPVTKYFYDVGDRLAKVCANAGANDSCGQARTFTYDNRGFLRNETHPENGTTYYEEYDARGHFNRRYIGTAYQFDLAFEYDEAERLKKVSQKLSASNSRPLKEFSYGVANDGVNKKNGVMEETVRHNWVTIPAATPVPFNVQVIERYTYGDSEGRISARVTTDYPCAVTSSQDCRSLRPVGANRSFEQKFQYDVLDTVSDVMMAYKEYPKCLLGACISLPARTVTERYSDDFLKSVTTGDGASAQFSYHPSGLIETVAHENGVVDHVSVDPLIPSRPKEIVTTGVTEVQACVKPSFNVQPQSQSLTGGCVTLSAAATGQDNLSISYQWYRGTAPDESNQIQSATVCPSVTTNYWVKATNSCGSSASATATMTVCNGVHITVPQADLTMTVGETRTVGVTTVGSESITYQWYTVAANGAETLLAGAVNRTLSISPSQTTHYRVRVTNSCDVDTDDVAVTVVPAPTTPGSILATYDSSSNRNVVTWSASTSSVGIHHYIINRQPGNLSFTVYPPALTSSDETALSSGSAYFYRVTAVDSNGISSAPSIPDVATVRTFIGDPLPNLAGVDAVYVSELRAAIDAVRAAAGLGPAWTDYTPPVRAEIRAIDFVQLRDRLNEARGGMGLSLVVLTAPMVPRELMYGSVLAELRNSVK